MTTQVEVETPKQKRGRERHEAIVEAATEVFLDRGYGSVSLDEIVARAGGSRRNIYDWFGNKERLFVAVVESACGEFLGQMEIPVGSLNDPAKTLRLFGVECLTAITSPKALALYRVVIGEGARFPELGEAFYQAGPAVSQARIQSCVEAWKKSGLIVAADPERTAAMILGILMGDLHTRALLVQKTPGRPAIEAHVKAAVRTIMGGLSSPRTK